jgi:hypothetical protein
LFPIDLLAQIPLYLLGVFILFNNNTLFPGRKGALSRTPPLSGNNRKAGHSERTFRMPSPYSVGKVGELLGRTTLTNLAFEKIKNPGSRRSSVGRAADS